MKLTYYPEPVLLNRCRELTAEEIANGKYDGQYFEVIFGQMERIMKANHGCGLAAPQAGLPIRLFLTEHGGQQIRVINPVIVKSSQERLADVEGCLSIPNVNGYVMRPERLVLAGLDEKGKPFEKKIKGWEARIICHEFDHLDGVLFIDKMAMQDQLAAKATLEWMRAEYEKKDSTPVETR